MSSAVYDEADHRSGALFAFDSSFDGDGPRGNLDPPFSARRNARLMILSRCEDQLCS